MRTAYLRPCRDKTSTAMSALRRKKSGSHLHPFARDQLFAGNGRITIFRIDGAVASKRIGTPLGDGTRQPLPRTGLVKLVIAIYHYGSLLTVSKK